MSKIAGIRIAFLAISLSPVTAAALSSAIPVGSMGNLRATVAASPALTRHVEADILSGAALLKTEKRAQQGNIAAEFDLGRSYFDMATLHRQGARKNISLGLQWYRRAALQGYAPAQARLASAYLSGLGVPKNEARALKWLRRATAQKYAPAEGLLGGLYLSGLGVPMNPHRGVHWIRLAARQGNAASAMSLGFMYFTGDANVPKNYTKAARWLLSAKAISAKMGIDLPVVTSMLQVAESHLSPAQISQVRKEVQKQLQAHKPH